MNGNLIVIGNISRDFVFYEGHFRGSFWGGAGLNICIAAYYADLTPSIISAVGSDAIDLFSEIASSIDLSVTQVYDGKTCVFELYYDILGRLVDLKIDLGVATQINGLLENVKLKPAHYHVSCREPLKPYPILKRLYNKKLPFSLDFIISSAALQIPRLANWFAYADYIFVNEHELQILKDNYDINKIKQLIVTAGKNPVKIFDLGVEIANVECPLSEFVDVTGAGDAFLGAFLASQLNGNDIISSAEKGVKIAQSSLDGFGVWRRI